MKPHLPLAAAALALAASIAFAQPQGAPADAPKQRNLQVLPRNIPQDRLMAVMQAFTRSLGVQCSHCHVRGDFASEANPNKEITRGMMRMTGRLNAELLPGISGLTEPRVSCFSCHRGAAEPLVELPPPASPAPPPPGS
jgi:predicted component of type VI protein secretion system